MMHTVLAPDYMKTFACVGSACELSCCTGGWNIFIDDQSMKKYLKCKDSEWRECFVRNIKPPSVGKKSPSFALTPEGDCVFLDADRLCGIQKRFGEGYLCNTCSNYPRLYMKIGGRYNKKATLTCPEVIKNVLLSPKQLSFIELQENIRPEKLPTLSVSDVIDANHSYYKYFNDLRSFSLRVLQNSSYTLTERLLILAYFFENLKNKVVDPVPIIVMFDELVEQKAIVEILKTIHTNRAFYYKTLQQIFPVVQASCKNDEFKDYCQRYYMMNFLGRDSKDTFFYIYDGEYKSFLHKNSLLLENYLVHSAFSSLFPLDTPDIWNSFVQLVLRFILTNFFLMGLVVDGKKDITKRDFLHCFAVMTRAFDSTTPSSIKTTAEFMDREGKNDLNSLFHLIKV